MGKLGAALARVAASSGVLLRCGVEVTNISLKSGRARSVVIGGREEIPAGVVVSALDLKSTVLDLMRWSEVSPELIRRAGQYRQAGQTARVLFALDAPPDLPLAREAADIGLGPIHVVPSFASLALAHEAWSAGELPQAPLVTLRIPSFADPRLAPVGKAVMTATLAAIPAQLHEGSWLNGNRGQLVAIALAAAERVMPGVTSRVIASKTIVGPDIETALGCNDGDLDGGELAPDQALGFRPFEDVDWQDGRTPIAGLYLGGSSSAASPFLLGASGERAALAVLTDLNKRSAA
jgi:phytoene dehydrogenase-like protein